MLLLIWLRGLLDPGKRAELYDTLAKIIPVVVMLGIISQPAADNALALVVACGNLLAMVVAMLNVRRLEVGLVYALSALGSALSAYGILTPGQVDRWTTLAAGVVAVLGPILARLRTDPSTPTGEPAVEFAARLAA